ncbi:uncharacterized protein ELE39_000342 [Cryptosporidium sp. chipmunk genotype I]|uniref:uncharacterized protein n=1 Tax=Cryptosporidium sp. chipmunk genotype I TaxID=1280935 RepID=UPI00351A2A1C|nr:hypothetical protein ELE39_000342 [Cryptosporidium sp. chipmunk genotype I]
MEFTNIHGELRIPLNHKLDELPQEPALIPEIAQVKLILDAAGICQSIDLPRENCSYSNHEIIIKKINEILPIKSEILDNIAILEVTLSNHRVHKKAVYFKFLKEEKESITENDVLISFH